MATPAADNGTGDSPVHDSDELNRGQSTSSSIPLNSVPQQLPHKTPISLLQECCLKKQINPQYELLSAEGQVHEPTFVYRCTVGEIKGTGEGKSKKLAKHMAAKQVLEQIVAQGKHEEWLIPGTDKDEAYQYLNSLLPDKRKDNGGTGIGMNNSKSSEGGPSSDLTGADNFDDKTNPIGRLQDRSTKLKLGIAEYELIEERGAPHERTFIVQVKLGKLTAEVEAKNKRTAKRMAAEKMLAKLADSQEGFDEDDISEEETEPGAAYPKELEAQLSTLPAAGPLITEEPAEGGTRTMEDLREMDVDDLPLSEDTLKLLREILVSQDGDPGDPIAFQKLPQLSVDGENQCLIQLSTIPVAVCHGSGTSIKAAEYSAARQALRYLKIMQT